MILLDTHVVVWSVLGRSELGRRAHAFIEAAEDRRMSAMVAWEIAMLAGKGRVTLGMDMDKWLTQVAAHFGIGEVPVTAAIAQAAGELPPEIHGDSCDRIIMATARALDCPLVTADRKILGHAAAGHLRAIDARM